MPFQLMPFQFTSRKIEERIALKIEKNIPKFLSALFKAKKIQSSMSPTGQSLP